MISYVPSAPSQVTVERAGPREVTVRWRAPKDDGGDEIIGYIVEMRECPDSTIQGEPVSRWIRVGPSLVRQSTSLRLTDLRPDMDLQFRVLAKNPVGSSEPSELTEWSKRIIKER
ncbi:unnamed protein product [Protopolystoma xenopodis]|uniref:Fibronectin type-III domain-containing protein n=1 Tax=Protopolystoma xenopodis TaxID=117903 RepID=A0A448X0Z0_9PLAT|nr:unnamed protein product [Protopolystoma xenopodis]